MKYQYPGFKKMGVYDIESKKRFNVEKMEQIEGELKVYVRVGRAERVLEAPPRVLGEDSWLEEMEACDTRAKRRTVLRAFAANLKTHWKLKDAAQAQPVSEGRLRELVAKWRKEVEHASSEFEDGEQYGTNQCAAELERELESA